MDDQACGLVDNKQMRVFEYHIQWDGLGNEGLALLGRAHFQPQYVSKTHFLRWLGTHYAIAPSSAFTNELLYEAAGKALCLERENAIQTLTVV